MADARAEMRRRLEQDRARLRRFQQSKFGYVPLTWFLDPAWTCVRLHRASHRAWIEGHRWKSRLLMQLNSLLTGADIMPPADIGGGLLVPSPCGVNLSCKAGRNLTALALAGIGGSVRDRDIGAGMGLPLLGDNVSANHFTGIQGSIRIGDGAVIESASGAVVDVAPGAHMLVPAEPEAGPKPLPAPAATPLPACRHSRWRETRAAFDTDVDRFIAEQMRYAEPGQKKPKRLGAILTNPLMALYVHRVSHWLHCNGHRRSANLLALANFQFHKLMIPPASCLSGGVLAPHLAGVLFAGRAGANLILYASSLCAPLDWTQSLSPAAGPSLGDDVMVGGQAAVMGPAVIGDRVQIGPKGQAHQDVPDDTQVWGRAAFGTVNPRRQDVFADAAVDQPTPLPFPAWRETRLRMAQDRQRLTALRNQTPEPVSRLLLLPAFLCVRLHRLSHYFHAAGRRRAARWCWLLNIYLTGADIAPQCEIGGGLLIPYPAGIALHCRAGADLTVLASIGIGTAPDSDGGWRKLNEAPQLGDSVMLSHHSGIYGAVTIGNSVHVQPGCTVTRSVPDGVTLVARPVKLRRRSATG